MSTWLASSTRRWMPRSTAGRASSVSSQRLRLGNVVDVLALALVQPHPADAGHVGDRISAGEKCAILEPRVHHAEEAVDLVGEAVDRVRLICSGA